MKKIISLALFFCLSLSTVIAQNNSQSEVMPIEPIAVLDFSLPDLTGKKADPIKWKKVYAEKCNLEIEMPENVSLESESEAFTEDSFIFMHIYHSNVSVSGLSYTVTCHNFPENYPFDQNSDRLLQLVIESILMSDVSRLLTNEELELYGHSGRQFTTKTGDTIFLSGRAIIIDRSIISFVSIQFEELSFEDSKLLPFFGSVQLLEN